MPLIFTTPTLLGSNSMATPGSSVVELITFAAISWSFTTIMIAVALCLCLRDQGKRSIERYVLSLNLEFYSQVTRRRFESCSSLGHSVLTKSFIWYTPTAGFVWCTTWLALFPGPHPVSHLRGLKARFRFSRARTEIACARRMWFCGLRNNHMTSMTSFVRVLAVISASLICCSFAATGEVVMTAKMSKPMLGDCSVT